MTAYLKNLLARTFPSLARDEHVNVVCEQAQKSRVQLQEALAELPREPELYEMWRDALKCALGGDG